MLDYRQTLSDQTLRSSFAGRDADFSFFIGNSRGPTPVMSCVLDSIVEGEYGEISPGVFRVQAGGLVTNREISYEYRCSA